MEKIQLAAAEKNQAEQLGKVTSQAQALQITNDLTRLRIKERIIALDEAIASGDVNAITAATNRLNEDLKIFGALSNQKIKLTEIEDILKKLLPKDLINLDNLRQAITLLGQIGGTGTTAVSMGTAPVMPSSLNPIAGAGGVRPSRGFTNEELNYFEARDQYQFGGSLSGLTPTASSAPINITVQTGVGDPNAIAEAIDQVLTDAFQRGTLEAVRHTMTWLPEWRVTVGDDVYTTVTAVSFASGRLDIDRQPTAGYCRVEIINTTGADFTINVTEPVL
jgi:hypothetical protein